MKSRRKSRSILKLRGLAPFVWRFFKATLTGRSRRGLYSPDGELEIKGGPSGRVEILRDGLGIPYVSARSWPDAAFGIGFCHGCDRLAQMELMRRLASGRLAEVVGKLALPVDIAARLVGYRRLAESYEKRIDGETAELLCAYARGVSEAMARRVDAGALPVEYAIFRLEPQPWTLTDSLVISRAACTDIGLANKPIVTLIGRADEKLRRLLLPFLDASGAADDGAAGGSDAANWGSNAWAVGPRRTEDGKPIVAADPHVGIQAPCLWYAAQVRIERTGEALAGLTVPGWPFFVLGRNRRVAWGATNMLADTADLFWETIEGDNYIVDGAQRPLAVTRDSIAVRGAGDVAIRIRRTHRGSIVSDSSLLRKLLGAQADQHVSLAWPAETIASDELAAFYRINRAESLTDFAAAVKSYGLCALNFIAADADGHIGQFPTAALPMRKEAPQGIIYDGTTSRHDWRGVAFPSPLPAGVDPPEGFVANANDICGGCNAETVGPLTCPPFRGDRLRELLGAAENLSFRRAAEVQADCYCRFTRELVDRIEPLLGEPTGSIAAGALKLLRGFDGRMEADSPAAAVAGVYSEFFRLRLFVMHLGPGVGSRFIGNYQSFPAAFRIIDSAGGEGGVISREDLGGVAAAAFVDTVRYLARRQGRRPARWRWGRAVKVGPSALLGRVPLLGRKFRISPSPARGSANAVSQLRFRFSPARKFQAAYLGVTARMVMPLGGEVVFACIQTGQSEDPHSRHFCDQYGLLGRGRYAEIALAGLPEALAESSLTLSPARAGES